MKHYKKSVNAAEAVTNENRTRVFPLEIASLLTGKQPQSKAIRRPH